MAVLFFAAVFAFVFSSNVNRLPFAVIEDGFMFPMSSSEFPDQFRNISFNGNKNLTLEIGDSGFNAFFAIPLNESNLAHEIHIFSNNASTYTQSSLFQHIQYLYIFSNPRNAFNWQTWNGITIVDTFSTSCYSYGSQSDNMKIQFYTNGTAIYNDEKTCDMLIQYNYTHGNYFYIPFTLSWTHVFESFTLEMGNGIKLAFYEGQYEDPPKEMEWPILELSTTTSSSTTITLSTTTTTAIPTTASSSTSTTPSTTSKIPTSSFPHSESEFNFSFFVQKNYDLLIIIVILCFLILFCSMAAIFLCCFLKSK